MKLKLVVNYILIIIILYTAFWAGKFCFTVLEDIKTNAHHKKGSFFRNAPF
jgi:hypothetical protein